MKVAALKSEAKQSPEGEAAQKVSLSILTFLQQLESELLLGSFMSSQYFVMCLMPCSVKKSCPLLEMCLIFIQMECEIMKLASHKHCCFALIRVMLQVDEAVQGLLEGKRQLRDLEEKLKAGSGIPKDASGNPDYSDDFFGRSAFLAVSGQLNAEAYACALTDVYTFGEALILSCHQQIDSCSIRRLLSCQNCRYQQAHSGSFSPSQAFIACHRDLSKGMTLCCDHLQSRQCFRWKADRCRIIGRLG